MLRDIKCERSFAHARASGDNDQIGILQTGCHVIDLMKTCRNAGDELLAGEEVFDGFETFPDDIFNWVERSPDFIFGYFKNSVLRFIKHLVNIGAGFVAAIDDFGC